jgi:hypothetical protein
MDNPNFILMTEGKEIWREKTIKILLYISMIPNNFLSKIFCAHQKKDH